MDIIRSIINRECHVALSNRQVIRHVISRMSNERVSWLSLPRAERKKLMRHMITIHEQNQNIYNSVMYGQW